MHFHTQITACTVDSIHSGLFTHYCVPVKLQCKCIVLTRCLSVCLSLTACCFACVCLHVCQCSQ